MTISADQRLVNEAYAHLKSTGVKSVSSELNPNGEYVCIYSGSGCAFSPAILPDCLHMADCKAQGALGIITEFPYLLHDWARDCNPHIARWVQLAHDRCTPREGESFFELFSERLKDVCADHNLDFPGE